MESTFINWPAIAAIAALISAAVAAYMAFLSKKAAKGMQWLQWVNEAVAEFKSHGTPVYYINALQGLSEEEKENLWQETFLRYGVSKPKETFKDASKELK